MGLYALALVCACHQTWMTRCQAGSSRCATTILSLNFPVERQPLAKTGWDKHTKTVSKPDRFLRTLVSSQGNTVIDAQMGIMVGGGRDTIVRGNNFINCDKGLHIDSRGMGENPLLSCQLFSGTDSPQKRCVRNRIKLCTRRSGTLSTEICFFCNEQVHNFP